MCSNLVRTKTEAFSGRKVEVKRIVLARLEGYSESIGELKDWAIYDE